MTIAVYPGTFDPVTNGHLDIARRAAALFDRVVMAVYEAPPKRVLFSTQERLEMVRRAVEGMPNITAESFDGLTVDFATRLGARAIVRGLRAVTDFEREFQVALINRKLRPDVEVVALMTSFRYSFLSSSAVKEMAQLGANVSDLVPAHVAEALQRKLAQNDFTARSEVSNPAGI